MPHTNTLPTHTLKGSHPHNDPLRNAPYTNFLSVGMLTAAWRGRKWRPFVRLPLNHAGGWSLKQTSFGLHY